MSGSARKALKSVMVLPEPGGPHSTKGLCSASHVYNKLSWRTVSMVGMTRSAAATLCVSTSTFGTLDCQGTHSPAGDTCTNHMPHSRICQQKVCTQKANQPAENHSKVEHFLDKVKLKSNENNHTTFFQHGITTQILLNIPFT